MSLKLLIAGITLLSSTFNTGNSFRDTYPKNPNIDVLNYVFELSLSDENDVIKGRTTVDVRFLKAGMTELRLDLINKSDELDGKGMTVNSVLLEGSTLEYRHEDDALFISLPQETEPEQRFHIVIEYQGIPATGLNIADNKHGDRTFFSDNWPNRGRNWLPTIDHPYDKAMCEFVVTAPVKYQVVSNGLKVEETDLGDGNRLTHWKQSVPIASWLYVLGVAQFAMQEMDKFDGKSIQTWVYYQDREAGFYDFAIPTKLALEFYSDYIGPFSYEKLANIQSNSVSGGMEAASAILYSDRSVVGDRNERWRNVVIHEVAHQWFGNSVTEYDWDDIWLSEGFATYFTLLFIEHQYGRDEFVKGLLSSKNRVYSFYEENKDYTIVHDNLDDMSKVTTSQIYQKGSWILHMLRGVVGTDTFWEGMRSYYAKYKDGHATTADFKREMEEASGMELSWFFEQWLYNGGGLKLTGDWEYNSGRKELTIDLEQTQDDGYLFTMLLEIAINFGDGKSERQKLQIDKKDNSFVIKVNSEPKEVILDPDVWLLMQADFQKK